MGEQAEEIEMVWKPKACSLNRYMICKYLIQLFPGLSPEEAENKRQELLKNGELLPYPKTDRPDPENTMCVDIDSWDAYEGRVYHQDEEARKRMLLRTNRKLDKLNKILEKLEKTIDELPDKMAKKLVEQREKERKKELWGG